MELQARIKAFTELARVLDSFLLQQDANKALKEAIESASISNPWFIKEFEILAIRNILPLLTEKRLKDWTSKYNCSNTSVNVGIIMAGNIPLVGFHDFLSTLICGHNAYVKMSGKDKHLLPAIIDIITKIEPRFKEKIFINNELPDSIDALIATGSNNTARYFEYYYKGIPKIIRKNRSSIAVLNGNETKKDYEMLAKDICTYFGLGCRNVSKIYIPKAEALEDLKKAIKNYNWLQNNQFYASNLKFQKARYKTIGRTFFDAGNLLLVEEKNLHSPVSVINYEIYEQIADVEEELRFIKENIQCIVGKKFKKALPLGSSQAPTLEEYADNIDTMGFLEKLPVGV